MQTNLPPSDPLGIQEPRIRCVPPQVASRGRDAIDVARIAGLKLDPWQQNALLDICGVNESGKWAAYEAALLVQRQNGKGCVLEALELAGLFIWDEKLIIHSAHQFKTAQEAFQRIRFWIENSAVLSKMVKKITTANGDEGIELKNGARLRFLARSSSSGRGFTGDRIIFDEALILPEHFMAAITPALAAKTVQGNPQLIYTSSTGVASSTVLRKLKDRAESGPENAGRLCYIEHSALSWDEMTTAQREKWEDDRDAWRRDPQVIAQANPALGRRIALQFFMDQLESPMTEAQFEREHLGVWEQIGGQSIISMEAWNALADEEVPLGEKLLSLGVDAPPSRDQGFIVAATLDDQDRVICEIIDGAEGLTWVPARLKELDRKWKPDAIVVDGAGAAGALLPDIKAERLRTAQLSGRDYAKACGLVYDLIKEGRLRHRGDPLLNDAIEAAQIQPLGESLWKWNRKNIVGNISPLVALTLAVWGLLQKEAKEKARRARGKGSF